MKIFLSVLLTALTFQNAWSATTALSPNDVSILMPLPLTPQQAESHLYMGKLLDLWPKEHNRTVIKKLFSTPPGSADGLMAAMLVTAFRFDPCFPKLNFDNPASCQAQIRLSAQYFYPADSGVLSEASRDEVSMHAFYNLSAQEAKEVVEALRKLKSESPVPTEGKPLFIHPALQQGGMGSVWGQKLKTMILKYAVKRNLVRVTGTGFVFDSWPFFAYQFQNGDLVAEDLQHLSAEDTVQSWTVMVEEPKLGMLTPQSNIEPGPLFFASAPALNQPGIQDQIDSLARVENPASHTPHSVDCVSCHISHMTKSAAIQKGLVWNSPFSYQAPLGANTTNLTDTRIQAASGNVVQFGYFLRNSNNGGLPGHDPLPSISDRVINESIEVARFLNRPEQTVSPVVLPPVAPLPELPQIIPILMQAPASQTPVF